MCHFSICADNLSLTRLKAQHVLYSHHDLLQGLEQNRRDVEDELRRLKHELRVADEQTTTRLRERIKRYEEEHEAILAEIDYEEAKISDERRISALKGKRRATASLEIVRRLMREVSEDRTKFGDTAPMTRKKYNDIQRYLRIAGEHESSAIRAILYLERAKLSFEHYNNPRRALEECKESIAINPNYEEAYLYRISIREQLRGDATFDQKWLERSIRSDKQKLRELRQNAAGNQTSDSEQKHASAADRSNPRRRPGRRAD